MTGQPIHYQTFNESKKYDLQYIIRHCKEFARQDGWKPTETYFCQNYTALTLVHEDDSQFCTTPQKLINDLFLLMSATNYSIDDAVIASDILFLKIAPLPPGCVKKEICSVSVRNQSTFILNPECSEEEFDTIRQKRRDGAGIFNHYPERST